MRLVSVPSEEFRAELADVPGVELVAWDMTAPHPRAAEISLAVTPYLTGGAILDHVDSLTGLEAVQLLTAGYEHVHRGIPSNVLLANAAGVHDASTAELAVALALAAQRELPRMVRAQDRGEWEEFVSRSFADSRVLVVGYGRIGQAIAERLRPFEVTITAVASRPRASTDGLVERVAGVEELGDLLEHADIVILVLPLSDETRGLIDTQALGRMPQGALLVNVGRGAVVDTDALVQACRDGRVRAALDVVDPEPLPSEHPLWGCPGVLISPHRGGDSAAFMPRATQLLRSQLTRWGAGESLEHVVAGPLGH